MLYWSAIYTFTFVASKHMTQPITLSEGCLGFVLVTRGEDVFRYVMVCLLSNGARFFIRITSRCQADEACPVTLVFMRVATDWCVLAGGVQQCSRPPNGLRHLHSDENPSEMTILM